MASRGELPEVCEPPAGLSKLLSARSLLLSRSSALTLRSEAFGPLVLTWSEKSFVAPRTSWCPEGLQVGGLTGCSARDPESLAGRLLGRLTCEPPAPLCSGPRGDGVSAFQARHPVS